MHHPLASVEFSILLVLGILDGFFHCVFASVPISFLLRLRESDRILHCLIADGALVLRLVERVITHFRIVDGRLHRCLSCLEVSVLLSFSVMDSRLHGPLTLSEANISLVAFLSLGILRGQHLHLHRVSPVGRRIILLVGLQCRLHSCIFVMLRFELGMPNSFIHRRLTSLPIVLLLLFRLVDGLVHHALSLLEIRVVLGTEVVGSWVGLYHLYE